MPLANLLCGGRWSNTARRVIFDAAVAAGVNSRFAPVANALIDTLGEESCSFGRMTGDTEHSRLRPPCPDRRAAKCPYCRRYRLYDTQARLPGVILHRNI